MLAHTIAAHRGSSTGAFSAAPADARPKLAGRVQQHLAGSFGVDAFADTSAAPSLSALDKAEFETGAIQGVGFQDQGSGQAVQDFGAAYVARH
jgi:hypothetical protein